MPATTAFTRLAPLAGLLWTLIRTDFKTRYHGSAQGFLWALIKPLAMFAVLMAVFSYVFGSDPNYRLNLIVGLFLWDFFVEATKTSMTSLQSKGFLLTKARLPAWVFVLASTANALIALVSFGAILAVYMAFTGHALQIAHAAWALFYLTCYFMIVLGIGLATSVLFVRYRDLNQVWDMVLQAGFFVAPIVYPLRIIPEHVHQFLYLWPPTPIIQFTRSALVDGVVPTTRAHLFLVIGTSTILAVGAIVFWWRAPRIAEDL